MGISSNEKAVLRLLDHQQMFYQLGAIFQWLMISIMSGHCEIAIIITFSVIFELLKP